MLPYPQAYLDYLHYFMYERDYFECHEVLEAYWKEHPNSPLRTVWVGLIQVAVGAYHHRRGNRAGALKMTASAAEKLTPEGLRELGIDAEPYLAQLNDRIEQLRRDPLAPYRAMSIPFADRELEAACLRRCGLAVWPPADRRIADDLLHKHTRRDRSMVIGERRSSLLAKQLERGGQR
ncbi:DUF309 domain-containing protein [Paenibacillus cymbidii]|uniref:DUF309 domain-containing protein n=1 Tax=Paenibacillus cymbidii TaxID=1639034 RepID=UPI001081AC1A|nr:DUF309 domain-containing protein [Paenibacillus cymbidii]